MVMDLSFRTHDVVLHSDLYDWNVAAALLEHPDVNNSSLGCFVRLGDVLKEDDVYPSNLTNYLKYALKDNGAVVNTKYLWLLLQTEPMQAYIQFVFRFSGLTRQSATRYFLQFYIPAPSIEEQNKLVDDYINGRYSDIEIQLNDVAQQIKELESLYDNFDFIGHCVVINKEDLYRWSYVPRNINRMDIDAKLKLLKKRKTSLAKEKKNVLHAAIREVENKYYLLSRL